MKQYGLTFHHFGLAVKSPNKAIPFLEGLGYTITKPIYDPLQGVELIWCESPNMPAIELIYSSTDISDSPLKSILKTTDELIYHLCYQSNDSNASIQLIKEDSIRVICISKTKPAILFNNKNVSFYKIDGFGIIEIIET